MTWMIPFLDCHVKVGDSDTAKMSSFYSDKTKRLFIYLKWLLFYAISTPFDLSRHIVLSVLIRCVIVRYFNAYSAT